MAGLGGLACSTFHDGTLADVGQAGPVCATDRPRSPYLGWNRMPPSNRMTSAFM